MREYSTGKDTRMVLRLSNDDGPDAAWEPAGFEIGREAP